MYNIKYTQLAYRQPHIKKSQENHQKSINIV